MLNDDFVGSDMRDENTDHIIYQCNGLFNKRSQVSGTKLETVIKPEKQSPRIMR